ncbi:P-loop containing nucleoside triphosphate hydrolase protein [Whalleya microplaca]|nr:P-loop containing nucleoside triphosphate hydrolase protein [Whalleya microplaca]
MVIEDSVQEKRIQELEDRLLQAQGELDNWKTRFDESQTVRDSIESYLRNELEAERARSRVLWDQIQDMKGSIRVMCRIRPAPSDTPEEDLVDFGPREKGSLSNTWGRINMPSTRRDVRGQLVTETRPFEFERIFGPEESNADVFTEISNLAQNTLNGQNVTIFCYGQTGSGKTYTMAHIDPDDRTDDGIISRSLAMMFEASGNSTQFSYSFDISIIEIYLDNIYDLLQEPIEGQKVAVRLGQASTLPLESWHAADEIIEIATKTRVSSSTNKNATSSRSHLILTFHMRREVIEGRNKGQVSRGVLNLVDLAGSERSASAGLSGTQLEEGININQSLSSLNRAITALGEGKTVAYDTMLMKALKPALTSDCKVLMFIMISPLVENLFTSTQTLEKGKEAANATVASIKRNENRRLSPASTSNRPRPSPSTSGVRSPATSGSNRPQPPPKPSSLPSPSSSKASSNTPNQGKKPQPGPRK